MTAPRTRRVRVVEIDPRDFCRIVTDSGTIYLVNRDAFSRLVSAVWTQAVQAKAVKAKKVRR